MTVPSPIRRLPGHDPALPLPAYATAGAAGMDVCASLPPEARADGLSLAPGARALVPTGLALEIPDGYEIQVRPRSGLALRHGIALPNSPGTIDSDYRGELGVILANLGSEPFTVTPRHAHRPARALPGRPHRLGGARRAGGKRPRRGWLRLDRDAAVTLSPDELERYARHIVLHEIGGAGQQRLKAARLLVVGAGGLGSPALLYLAAAGVGHLTVVDDDAVSLSNLQRQVLHATPDIGRSKVASAAAALARLNPHVAVEGLAFRLDEETAARPRPRPRPRPRRQRQLRDPLCRQCRLRRRRRPAPRRGDEPVGGADRPLSSRGRRPLLRLRLPGGARPGADALLRPRRHRRRARRRDGLAPRAGSDQAGDGRRHRPPRTLLLYDALHAETRRIRTARRPGCPVCGASRGDVQATATALDIGPSFPDAKGG